VIAETSQFPDHLARAHFLRLCADRWSAFVRNALVKNLPDQPTEAVGDGADRFRVSKTRDKPSMDDREDRAFGFDYRVRRLIFSTRRI
jgi:hypothetical protein